MIEHYVVVTLNVIDQYTIGEHLYIVYREQNAKQKWKLAATLRHRIKRKRGSTRHAATKGNATMSVRKQFHTFPSG